MIIQTSIGKIILTPLKYYGQMALTNYICQTLCIFIYTQFILKTSLSLTHSLLMCLIIYVIQIILSAMWLKYFTNGPLEYIWRTGTYLKRMKVRRFN